MGAVQYMEPEIELLRLDIGRTSRKPSADSSRGWWDVEERQIEGLGGPGAQYAQREVVRCAKPNIEP